MTDTKENIEKLQKAIEELKTEDILELVVSVKGIEKDIKYIKEKFDDIEEDYEKLDDSILAQEKEIGSLKIWFIPIAFMWTVLAAVVGWILKQGK